MTERYKLMEDINNPNEYHILDVIEDKVLRTGKDNVDELNKLYKENEKLKDEIYEGLDEIMELLKKEYEHMTFHESQRNTRIYNKLNGLKEELKH